MSIKHWTDLVSTLEVPRKLHPVKERDLLVYEKTNSQLPSSYKDYCQVFGSGELAEWLQIATPGYSGDAKNRYDLTAKTEFYHNNLEWNEYAPDPDQFRRAIIFGDDSTGTLYFWDPERILGAKTKRPECAIYAIFRNWTVQHICNSFADFIDVCLHQGKSTIRLYTDSPKRIFKPAQARAKGKRRK